MIFINFSKPFRFRPLEYLLITALITIKVANYHTRIVYTGVGVRRVQGWLRLQLLVLEVAGVLGRAEGLPSGPISFWAEPNNTFIDIPAIAGVNSGVVSLLLPVSYLLLASLLFLCPTTGFPTVVDVSAVANISAVPPSLLLLEKWKVKMCLKMLMIKTNRKSVGCTERSIFVQLVS
jgi:hypothetical protein